MTKEQQEVWGKAIGGLLLNFGFVEFASLQWIDKLSTDKVVREIAIDLPFSRRVAIIRGLVRRSGMPSAGKKAAISLWDEVSDLSKTRNVLAHNPLCFRHVNGKLEAGVINTKRMKGIGPFKLSPVTIADVCRAGSRVAHLIAELGEIFGGIPDCSKKPTA